ncbi:hypothetical protein FGO68_gene7288 [Halteria grandinella]|uniref:Uncharacterized protein n=1 Tax=Halteria grandinella TaxID=5974 RepID=A0A8J8P093_HALGN|nr:hypothetical protein FGO68_gene7288 [Halteria grandinella]
MLSLSRLSTTYCGRIVASRSEMQPSNYATDRSPSRKCKKTRISRVQATSSRSLSLRAETKTRPRQRHLPQ